VIDLTTLYQLASKEDLIEIIHACIDQGNFKASIELVNIVQKMTQEGRDKILIKIVNSNVT